MKYVYNPLVAAGLDNIGTDEAANAGGSDTQIQFNDSGSLGGDVDLTWNKTTNVMTVAGDVNLSDGGTYTTTLQTITPTANRTVSIPDATGTVALVAGSSGQPIYNNAGAYAGLSTATIGTTGNITLSLNGASGVSPVALTGTWFAGTTPQVLIQPSTATAGAWSASGTGLGVNAASGFAGNLLDLQVNGTRALALSYDTSNTAALIGSGPTVLRCTLSNGSWNPLVVRTEGIVTGSNGYYSWTSTSNNPLGVQDLYLYRDAANTLAQRNGTNAQVFRVYNTYTSSTNYELGKLEWTSNVFRIGTEKGSGGGTARTVEVHTDSIARLAFDTTGSVRVVTGLTVATLPGTPAVGMVARVTDATAPAVGSTVAGGGAAAALVWYNGTNWTVIGV